MSARPGPRCARVVAAVMAMTLTAACGGGGDSAARETPILKVAAATSLERAFTAYARRFRAADVRLSFAGSDVLAAQIRQGVRPDVFAAANTKLPEQLAGERLALTPRTFASNRLVLAVPARSGAPVVASLDDLSEPGVTIAVGARGVPVGAYTRTVLKRLPSSAREGIEANIRSEEPDVGGVVGKLTQGAVDAGFVYETDVRGAAGALRAIPLPARLRPTVAYGAAVIDGAREPAVAKAFLDGLLEGAGRDALRAAGFRPPPPPPTG